MSHDTDTYKTDRELLGLATKLSDGMAANDADEMDRELLGLATKLSDVLEIVNAVRSLRGTMVRYDPDFAACILNHLDAMIADAREDTDNLVHCANAR